MTATFLEEGGRRALWDACPSVDVTNDAVADALLARFEVAG